MSDDARGRHLQQPALRAGFGSVAVDADGFPEWSALGRAVVTLPDPAPELTLDEVRVLDVLTANEVMITAGDPLWEFTADAYAPMTPSGWVWAHQALTRTVVLVPAELHAAFRHLGGVATTPFGRARRGVAVDSAEPVPMDYAERLADDLMDRAETRLGHPLPAAYRRFLARTNGAAPTTPGIHPGFGFVVDQPFFGLSRAEEHQDLWYANQWLGDRLACDVLAVGYAQGGLIAVCTTGQDAGSVWYHDDDDERDEDGLTADRIRARPPHRCADDFDAFWASLRVVPAALLDLVDRDVADGRASRLDPPDLGASLPPNRRA